MIAPAKPSQRKTTLADWGEHRFLEWVRRIVESPDTRGEKTIRLSIGDDAAHLKLRKRGDLLVTTDALIEGVHFRRKWISARELGAKSLTSNLSDIAAMGGRPTAAFLSLGVPPSTPVQELKAFFLGMRNLGLRMQCPLAGGDLVRAPQWVINVTVLGRPQVGKRVVTRSACKPGQIVYVTGSPGESAAGLYALRKGLEAPALVRRHNRPEARLDEAGVLARRCSDLAMMDVSDGIKIDAGHLAERSAVCIEIDWEGLPVSRRLKRFAESVHHDARDWVLDGGEDYELLFATKVGEKAIRRAFTAAGIRTPIHTIGRVAEGEGFSLLNAKGKKMRRQHKGFRHFS